MILALPRCLMSYFLYAYIRENDYRVIVEFWKMFLAVFIVIKVALFTRVNSDNFPSLLTSNATLAVVIDKEYLAEQYEPIKGIIEDYLVYAKREILKHGGVNVQYFSWTNINIKRDYSAIFSIASCDDTWNLFRAASEEHILHLAISETDCPRMPFATGFTVPLIKVGEEMPQLLLDLRTSGVFKWKSIVIFFDITLDRDIVTRVITALTKESEAIKDNAAISVIGLVTNSSTAENRQFIKKSLEKISTETAGGNFLAIVAKDTTETLMELSRELGLVTTDNQWLYLISDTNSKHGNISSVEKFLKEGDNIALIYNTTNDMATCKDGIGCHSEEIIEAFTKALELAIIGEYEQSSQVSDEEWEAIRPTKLERKNSLLLNIRTHLMKFGKCGNCTTWKLQAAETWGKEFQTSSNKSSPQLINVGSWRPGDGTSMTDELFPHVAHGFRGRTLPLITFHNPPWQIIGLNDSGQIEYSGIVFDIIKVLSDSLNFTYTVDIFKVDSKNYTMASNYSSSANNVDALDINDLTTSSIPEKIIDKIRNKEIALGAAVFTITEHSKTIINFTMPLSTQTYSFLVARPRELGRALLFMSPFTTDTWLCLAAAIVSMGPVLHYVHKLSPVYEYKGISTLGGLSSIQNCIWYMYGALLQQGGMYLPQADSARIIVGSWWLVVLVIATTYCGNLVAFLTFPKIDIPIATLDDLLSHADTVSWSISKGSFLENQLKISKEPKQKKLYTGAIGLDLNSKEMLPLIEAGKHVFIDWRLRLQYVMRKQYLITDRCDMSLGSEEFNDEQIGMIIAQDTPYLHKFNREIKNLHQNGLIQKWLRDYMPKKDKCFKVRHVSEVNNHTVNMDDMQGSFFVLFFGFTIAALLICIEKLWHRHKLKKERKIIQPYTT